MNSKELAATLNNREYGAEITKDEETLAKGNNLVVVFGYSDDNMELRGAIYDEVGCYEGGSAYITADGLFETCECDCKYSRVAKEKTHELSAHWCEGDVASWEYDIDVPFEPFSIMEDGGLYCVGIVFSLDDAK